MTAATPALGFIGLGIMGGRMVSRLLDAGYRVTVWNRTPAKLEPAIAKGAVPVDSPAELTRHSELVHLCVLDTGAVDEVVFGEGGVAEGAAAGKLLIDHSTILPSATRDFGAQLRRTTGMGWIDAPMTGGPPGAANGTLVMFGGGEEEEIERVRPVIEHLARRFVRMGPIGAGQATKMVNQVGSINTVCVLAEMIRLAERNGVDATRLPEVLEGGFADSRVLQVHGRRMASRDPEVFFHMTSGLKDFRLVDQTARDSGARMLHTGLTTELIQSAIARGYGERDVIALVDLYD
jgi:3-hydroxyisobutyrate dehydrogenase